MFNFSVHSLVTGLDLKACGQKAETKSRKHFFFMKAVQEHVHTVYAMPN